MILFSTVPCLHAFEYQNFPSYEKAMTYYLNKFKTKDYIRPDSELIKLAIYYPNTQRKVMLIQLKNTGSLMIYENVPKLTWFNFTEAKSKDEYFNLFITNKFPFKLKQVPAGTNQ